MTQQQNSIHSHSPNLSLDRRMASLLPVPKGEDIAWFQSWYKTQKGVDLPYEVARPMLTHLVQFYFLTRGHELYDHNQRIIKNKKRQPKATQADFDQQPRPAD